MYTCLKWCFKFIKSYKLLLTGKKVLYIFSVNYNDKTSTKVRLIVIW